MTGNGIVNWYHVIYAGITINQAELLCVICTVRMYYVVHYIAMYYIVCITLCMYLTVSVCFEDISVSPPGGQFGIT